MAVDYVSTVPDICTCHQVREGAGGVSFSLAILGVACGYCEDRDAEYAYYRRLAEETPRERAERVLQEALWAAESAIRRRRLEADDSPF